MTQAFNLSQLANNVNTSGQVNLSSGVYGTLPSANNGGVTSITASTGISVSASTGGVTITNTQPNKLTITTGSPNYYGLRAWANYDGQNQVIFQSVNVSSIGYRGTGLFTTNFATAMPDSYYAFAGGSYAIKLIVEDDVTIVRTTTQHNWMNRGDGGNYTNQPQISLFYAR